MPPRKASSTRISNQPFHLLLSRFSHERSTKAANSRYLLDGNLVSLTIPRSSTHRHLVEEIAKRAQIKIPIEFLCDELSSTILVRGKVCFGYVGNLLDAIAQDYDGMIWWISDQGLNMAIAAPDRMLISSFDDLAGRLTAARWRGGRLSKEALNEIAKALDQASFSLREHLQPAQWKQIAQHNQLHPRAPIKTFEEAIHRRQFARAVRRRLYVARQAHEKAHSPTF
jgi:hypothetical protein